MKKGLIIGAALIALGLAGCTGSTTGDRALVGGGIGAATGAVIGGLVTGRAGGAAVGALIGGASGAVIGASTTPQCQAVDRRGRRLVDQYGDPILVAC